jgi:hypothetical protein
LHELYEPHELQLDLQHFTLQHLGARLQQLDALTSAALMARLTAATAATASDNSLRVIAIPPGLNWNVSHYAKRTPLESSALTTATFDLRVPVPDFRHSSVDSVELAIQRDWMSHAESAFFCRRPT